MKNSLLYILSIFSLFLLFGCTKGLNDNLVESNPRFVTHAMGKTQVPYNPKRVVTLTSEATEAMLILDQQPIGAVKSYIGSPWWNTHIKNQMTGVQEVGFENNIDIDKIASLKPDLIIGSKALHEKLYDKLSYIAPTIFTEHIMGEFKGNLNLYAEAVNKTDQMSEAIINYNSRARRVRNVAQSQKIDQKYFAVIGFFKNETRLFLQSSFIGTILDDLQLKQTEFKKQSNQQDYVIINKTDFQTIAKNSNILIYFVYNDEAKKIEEEWMNDPIVKNLTGTTLEKVIEVSPDVYYASNGILAANTILDELEVRFKNKVEIKS